MAEERGSSAYSIDGSIQRLKRAWSDSCGLAFDSCIADWMRKPQSALEGVTPTDYLKEHGERGERQLLRLMGSVPRGAFE